MAELCLDSICMLGDGESHFHVSIVLLNHAPCPLCAHVEKDRWQTYERYERCLDIRAVCTRGRLVASTLKTLRSRLYTQYSQRIVRVPSGGCGSECCSVVHCAVQFDAVRGCLCCSVCCRSCGLNTSSGWRACDQARVTGRRPPS